MAIAQPSASAVARADAWVDAGPDAPLPAFGDDPIELAWALKDLCQRAWSTEPQRAVRAAEVLQRLASAQAAAPGAATLNALACWSGGMAQLIRGDMRDALLSLDRAEALFAGGGDRLHAAETQVPKIVALSMLGQHAAAAACGERALKTFTELGERHAAGRVSLNLGNLHLRRRAFADAAVRFREAAVLCARTRDHEHSVVADIGLAAALAEMGDFDQALLMYARAGMRCGHRGLPVLAAVVEESVALVQLARGRYREALAGFEGARRRYEALQMPQQLAIAEKQLADAYLELRLLPEALALYDEAQARFQALQMPDDAAWTLAQRGRTQALLGQTALAIESLLHAGQAFTAQSNVVGHSAVMLARAELALATNDADGALSLADQAARGYADAALPDGSCRAELARARALLKLGSSDEARAAFKSILQRASDLQLLSLQVDAWTGLGLAEQAGGDDEAARTAFESAIELFEDQRRALPGDEIRSAFLADRLRPYRELLRAALATHARSGAPDAAAAVLQQLDRMRARSLAERLLHAEPVEPPDDATAALRARLAWLNRRLQRLQDDGEPAAAVLEEARRTERQLIEQTRRQRLVTAAAGERSQPDASLDPGELQAALGAHDALVSYGRLDDELFACVVRRDRIVVQRRVAHWPDVVEACRSARFQIETLNHGSAVLARHLPTLTGRATARMRRLHQLVWAALEPHVDACRRVVVVPQGELAALPFAAFDDDGGACLAERHALSMAPSARVALHALHRPPQRSGPHLLTMAESSRLPHAAAEAAGIASLFDHARTLVDESATVDALQRHAGEVDIVHLACHAQFRSDNPAFSALHLHDGPLAAEAVERLRLRGATVVLSACETALDGRGDGDEGFGLVRAFLVGGAARVVASLWPVDDAVTAEFMSLFYPLLRDGKPAAEALRAAQAMLRRHRPHPAHWAAFALFGAW